MVAAIPSEVLRAHLEGRLVFFCGVGISRYLGLPDFAGLVRDVCWVIARSYYRLDDVISKMVALKPELKTMDEYRKLYALSRHG